MTAPAIHVEGLGKKYRLGQRHRSQTMAEAVSRWLRGPFSRAEGGDRPASEIWALRDVGFDIRRGEVVGIIGRNGAGKSTLLKILARITEPTCGHALVHGRMGSLLEVGTGFHPELTGRENVYLSGAVLGMRKREIDGRFDAIVDFAELADFIDTPVKRYSSGMYMRLAFAVAAHLEPEILLVDEVLAVGDAAFQRKCLGKMGDIAHEGRTVLFVSHNMAAVSNLCPRAILVDGGRVVTDGASEGVVTRYLEQVGAAATGSLSERTDRQGSQVLRFVGFALLNAGDVPVAHAQSGGPLRLALHYEAERSLANVQVSVAIHGPRDERLFYLSTLASGRALANLPDKGSLVCEIPRVPLLPGRYVFSAISTVDDRLADWVQGAGVIEVASGDFFGTGKLPPESGGCLLVDHHWMVADAGAA